MPSLPIAQATTTVEECDATGPHSSNALVHEKLHTNNVQIYN